MIWQLTYLAIYRLRWRDGVMDGYMEPRVDNWMDRSIDKEMYGSMDGWMDE